MWGFLARARNNRFFKKLVESLVRVTWVELFIKGEFKLTLFGPTADGGRRNMEFLSSLISGEEFISWRGNNLAGFNGLKFI